MFASTWCSDELEKKEDSTSYYIRTSQNVDGSWGDKNKIYCTASCILMYLCQGETPTSKYYGETVKKGMKFLAEHKENLNKQDRDMLLLALAESYAMTGVTMIEDAIKPYLSQFEKSITWNYQNSPEEFFIQSSTVCSLYIAGFEDKFLDEYINKIHDMELTDSLSLAASKTILRQDLDLNHKLELLLSESIRKRTNTPEQELISIFILVYQYDNKIKRNALSIKLQSYMKNDLKYVFKDSLSNDEKELLQKVVPAYQDSCLFPPRSYFPSNSFKKKSKEENCR